MFTEFENFIRENAVVSGEDIKLIRSLAVERTLRRKELLLQQGEVCRYKVFIAKGLLRMYTATDDGREHVMQFSAENNWITDPESMDTGTPSKCNIEALEPSEVVLWTKTDLRYLIANVPGLKAYFDKLISRSGYIFRQRILSTISGTAEEKYEEFVKNYPDIFARVPLHMVASYLGVSRETLSRVRHAQMSSK